MGFLQWARFFRVVRSSASPVSEGKSLASAAGSPLTSRLDVDLATIWNPSTRSVSGAIELFNEVRHVTSLLLGYIWNQEFQQYISKCHNDLHKEFKDFKSSITRQLINLQVTLPFFLLIGPFWLTDTSSTLSTFTTCNRPLSTSKCMLLLWLLNKSCWTCGDIN